MGYTQAVSLTSSGAEASLLAGPDCLRCVGGDQRQAVGIVRVPVLSFEAGLSSQEAFIDLCAARSRFHDAIARRSVFRVRICAARLQTGFGLGGVASIGIFMLLYLTGSVGSIPMAIVSFYGAWRGWQWPIWGAALFAFPFVILSFAFLGVGGF